MGIFAKYITKTVKEAVDKRGKLSRIQRSAFKKQINKASEDLEITPTEAEKGIRVEVKSPKPPAKKTGEYKPKKKNPSTNKNKGSNKGLTAEERREKAKLMRQSKNEINLRKKGQDIDDMPKDAPGGRERELIDIPGTRRQRVVAGAQNKLKGSQKFSKAELENMNPSERLEYELRGIGGSGSAMGSQMKRSGKGSMDDQSKKYGGKVKRNMGGKVTPRKKAVFRRGGGKALRGFGKATYSNKMY